MLPVTMHCPILILQKRGALPDYRGPGGAFRLLLRVLHDQGPHPTRPAPTRKWEFYVVTWSGPAAAAWWEENQAMPPGTPLELELVNPRVVTAHGCAPEIHATVTHCKRLPRSHEIAAAAASNQPQAA